MNRSVKGFILQLAIFAVPMLSFGQDFLPALNDNYMGINQVFLQPAAIADSRFRTDWNVAGFNNDIYNDAIRFRSRWILYPAQIVTNDEWWNENTYMADANGKDKSMFMSQSALGPGFLANLDKKSRYTIGFTSRVRSITNVDGMDEPLFRLMYSNYNEKQYFNKWYFDEKMRAMQHVFGDYGITYAQVIPVLNDTNHFFKGGVTLKLLQGIASSYLQTDELYYYFNGDEYPESKLVSWNTPYAKAGISDNWGDIDENGNYSFDMNYQWTAKPSVGFDLGLVYEFRKDFIKEKKNDSIREVKVTGRLSRPDLNKYFLKVGVSLLDVGSLTYQKDYYSSDLITYFTPDYLTRYQSGDNSVPDNTYWIEGDEVEFNYRNYVPFSQEMHRRSLEGEGVVKEGNNKKKYYVKLPAAVSLQADLNLFLEGLYVNVTTYWPLKTGYSHAPNSHYISNYSITPRYEHKWYGVQVPVQINQYGKLSVGLGVRAGIVYMGVNNLFSNTFSDPYGINAYVGVKVPVHNDRDFKDRDHDKVPNKLDHCPKIPGPQRSLGCPDFDGDSIPDKYDLCPEIFGLRKFRGCPDSDADGIVDSLDLCPYDKGPKLTNGCPDLDNDGVIDGYDECPDTPGSKKLNGCPDKDGDQVPDIKDKCPDVAGPIYQGGCPFIDTDGDAIQDIYDYCPNLPGPPENNGCPYTDTDGDGIIDKDDRCISIPGDKDNYGCPKEITKDQNSNNQYLDHILFESGQAMISSKYYKELDILAEKLNNNNTKQLIIEGFTDNIGNEDDNLKLSEFRAKIVSRYLESKGVRSEQLIISWHGESNPLFDNSTKEGLANNRRVNLTIR